MKALFLKSKLLIKSLVIGIIILVVIVGGYYLRLDRFGMSKISWIDCVQIKGNRYEAASYNPEEIDEDMINQKIGIVTFNVGRKVGNPVYSFRNGDATYLEVGTVLYSIVDETDKIAAFVDGSYRVYKKSK